MRIRLLPLLFVLALTLPTALASWQSSFAADPEPSTPYDTPDRVWATSPTTGADRIYFDLLYTPASLFGAVPHYEAVLAAWRDCNRDGIMGSPTGETYASALLLDLSLCPRGTRHNDGVVVRELLWIGPGAPFPHVDDPDARVWLDVGTPGAAAPPTKTSADDTLLLAPAGPRWVGSRSFFVEPAAVTGYARIGPAAMASLGAVTPSNAAYVYGVENCGGPGPLVRNGWHCDPAAWTGSVRLGDPYHLRDVDCTSPC